MARLGDITGLCRSLGNLGLIAYERGELATARTMLADTVRLARVLGNYPITKRALRNAALAALTAKDHESAVELLEELHTLAGANEDPEAEAQALSELGVALEEIGDSERAGQLVERAIPLFEETGNMVGLAFVQRSLAHAASKRGDLGSAEAHVRSSLMLSRVSRDHRAVGQALRMLAGVYEAKGDKNEAAALWADAATHLGATGDETEAAEAHEGLASLTGQL